MLCAVWFKVNVDNFIRNSFANSNYCFIFDLSKTKKMTTSILVHNIAGELASKYVCYLAQKAMGQGLSHKYFKENWTAEYNSRVKIMNDKPELIETLNGFNGYYQCEIKQQGEIKRKFYYES